MDMVKIKRVKRQKKRSTAAEKIMAGLGLGTTLLGMTGGAVAPKKSNKAIVRTNASSRARQIGLMMHQALQSSVGTPTAKAAETDEEWEGDDEATPTDTTPSDDVENSDDAASSNDWQYGTPDDAETETSESGTEATDDTDTDIENGEDAVGEGQDIELADDQETADETELAEVDNEDVNIVNGQVYTTNGSTVANNQSGTSVLDSHGVLAINGQVYNQGDTDVEESEDGSGNLVAAAADSIEMANNFGNPQGLQMPTGYQTFQDESETSEAEADSEAEPAAARTYKVKKGDTLWGISRKYYGRGILWRKIMNANADKVTEPRLLQIGTVLTIPPLEQSDLESIPRAAVKTKTQTHASPSTGDPFGSQQYGYDSGSSNSGGYTPGFLLQDFQTQNNTDSSQEGSDIESE